MGNSGHVGIAQGGTVRISKQVGLRLTANGVEAEPLYGPRSQERALSGDGILLLEFVGRVATGNDDIIRLVASESFASGVWNSAAATAVARQSRPKPRRAAVVRLR
jgi:hypothetical protein